MTMATQAEREVKGKNDIEQGTEQIAKIYVQKQLG